MGDFCHVSATSELELHTPADFAEVGSLSFQTCMDSLLDHCIELGGVDLARRHVVFVSGG
jgi:hypothetical protein